MLQIKKFEVSVLYNIGNDNSGIFNVTFDRWVCPRDSFDPVFSFAKAAAELSDAKLRVIDAFYEYEISNDDFCAVFCWNGGFTIMTYVKREIERGFTYETLKNACISINNELNLQ